MTMAMAVAVPVAVGYTACHVRCTSRAHARASSPRMARAINVSLPHAIGTRALRCGVGARSLARSRARGAWRWRWRWRWRSVTPRVIRVMRITCAIRLARVYRVIAARHQRFPSELSLARDRHARAAVWWRRSLNRSITRTQCVAVAMAVAAEVGYTARPLCHAHHMRHSSRARAPRHHRASSAFPFRALPRARSARTRCCGGGACSLALSRARCGGDGGGGDSGGGRSRRASRVPRVTRARARVMNTRPAHHHCFHSSMSPTRARGR